MVGSRNVEEGESSSGRVDGAPAAILLEDKLVTISDLAWIDAPGILAFWVLAVIVFLQFFTRYVLNDSLAWTEEVARYLMILVCFLGSISATRRASHIMIEFFIRSAPPKFAKTLAVLAEFITFGFYGTLTWIGIELTQKTRQKMISLPIPKAWIYAVCVVALALMTVYSAIWLWRKWRAPADEIADMLENGIRAD